MEQGGGTNKVHGMSDAILVAQLITWTYVTHPAHRPAQDLRLQSSPEYSF